MAMDSAEGHTEMTDTEIRKPWQQNPGRRMMIIALSGP